MDNKFIKGFWPEALVKGNTITLQALSSQCLLPVKEFTACVGGKKYLKKKKVNNTLKREAPTYEFYCS